MSSPLHVLADPRMLHAAMVHLPVALSGLGVPVALLLAVRGGPRSPLRGLAVASFGTLLIALLASVESGEAARARVGPLSGAGANWIAEHGSAARLAWIPALGATLGAGLSFASGRSLARFGRVLCLVGALACAGWIGLVAHRGGTAVYRFGVGVDASGAGPPAESNADNGGASPGSRSGDPRVLHFRERIRPLLAARCQGCHGPAPLGSSGLDLTSPETLLAGGDRGPALVPGRPEESLLFQAVSGSHAELSMPRGGPPLEERAIEDLRVWIESGAVWASGR